MSAVKHSRRVGIVGLGAMGGAMGANLLAAGFPVTGFDVDTLRLERLVELGGTAAFSPAEVAAGVEIVITSLPTEAAFEHVVTATDGLAEGAHPGLVVVEMSTLPIALKQLGREALAGRGATLLDCPISGTGDQAVVGDLVILASGDEAAVRRCGPAFDAVARAHPYVGEFGAGSKIKFIANLLVAVHNVAAAEAMSLADAAGLDLAQTLDVLLGGAGTSRMLEIRGPKMIGHDYASGMKTSVFQKDLGLIQDFARDHGAPVPLLSLCAQLYVATAGGGYADQDTAAVFEVLTGLRSDGGGADSPRGAPSAD